MSLNIFLKLSEKYGKDTCKKEIEEELRLIRSAIEISKDKNLTVTFDGDRKNWLRILTSLSEYDTDSIIDFVLTTNFIDSGRNKDNSFYGYFT